jgi:anti-sigma factor RsiW
MSTFLHRVRVRLDHRWAPDHMSNYLDGELGVSGQGRLNRHVAECDECRRILAGLRAMLDALHGLPAPTGGTDAVRIATAVRGRLGEPPAS